MKTLVIGHKGSMGQRYCAILKHLKIPFCGVDKDVTSSEVLKLAEHSKNVIICTPTESHYFWAKKLIPMNKNILCEKPITKSLEELTHIFDLVSDHKSLFTMTMQYKELVKDFSVGTSEYNYFRTGKDGLAWDCLQIIGLARGPFVIDNKSPIWKCKINGIRLNLSDMDLAYVNYTRKFLFTKKSHDLDFLFEVHRKTNELNKDLDGNLQ